MQTAKIKPSKKIQAKLECLLEPLELMRRSVKTLIDAGSSVLDRLDELQYKIEYLDTVTVTIPSEEIRDTLDKPIEFVMATIDLRSQALFGVNKFIKDHRIVTIRDLLVFKAIDLINSYRISTQTVYKIEAVLNSFGLHLGMTIK